MTKNQIRDRRRLILALAVGSQVLASRLRIPAIIVLLPTGLPARQFDEGRHVPAGAIVDPGVADGAREHELRMGSAGAFRITADEFRG